jgi:hypothetical protein
MTPEAESVPSLREILRPWIATTPSRRPATPTPLARPATGQGQAAGVGQAEGRRAALAGATEGEDAASLRSILPPWVAVTPSELLITWIAEARVLRSVSEQAAREESPRVVPDAAPAAASAPAGSPATTDAPADPAAPVDPAASAREEALPAVDPATFAAQEALPSWVPLLRAEQVDSPRAEAAQRAPAPMARAWSSILATAVDTWEGPSTASRAPAPTATATPPTPPEPARERRHARDVSIPFAELIQQINDAENGLKRGD